MEIGEVEDILNSLRLLALLAPQHVLITDEPIYQKVGERTYFFRGLSPKQKRSTMILSAQADKTTVPHEWVHSALGLGEASAYPIGAFLAAKYELSERFPFLKNLRLFQVKYKESTIPSDYRGRVKHYVKE